MDLEKVFYTVDLSKLIEVMERATGEYPIAQYLANLSTILH